MSILIFCPVDASIREHCNSVDAPELTADDYLQCADYLADYVKSGNDLHFAEAGPLKSIDVIGDYLADTKSAFNEFTLMLTDPIAASAAANKNLEAYIADSIYHECLKNEAFPIEYQDFNNAA
jgi:hypothetical protein